MSEPSIERDSDIPYARRTIGFLPLEAREKSYGLVRGRRGNGPLHEHECSEEAEGVQLEVEEEEGEEDE